MVYSKIFKLLQQRSIQVLLVLTLYTFFAAYLPLTVHQLFYTISLFIKDVLLWIMPFAVCFFIAHTVQSFERRAPLFVLILLVLEGTSNFSSVWYAYLSAHSVADFLPPFQSMTIESDFKAFWRLPFIRPSWWGADKGAMLGLLLGGSGAFDLSTPLKNFINRGKGVMEWVLARWFARLIPLYILGFVAQMHQTELLSHVVSY